MIYIILYTTWSGQQLWEQVDVGDKVTITNHACDVANKNNLTINAILEMPKKVVKNGDTVVADKFYKYMKEE